MSVSFPGLSIQARSLNIPDSAHPNKLPFSGVLTRIDEPSDSPPEGSNGRRVLVTRAAAERALDSLLGMGVNYNPDGHSPQKKVGVIFGSEIVGSELHIHGAIYAADFPDATAAIRANKDKLGFSFEARDLFTPDPDADPVHISDLSFTGAAILLKNAAAYKTTSIFASKNKDTEPMSFLNRMSAADRTKLADQISSANEHMTIDERRDLVDKLTVALGTDLKAKAVADRKHEILSRIHACENDVANGGKAELVNANNTLRNAGIAETCQELAFLNVVEVDRIFAAATRKFDSTDRMAVKRVLVRRLGW